MENIKNNFLRISYQWEETGVPADSPATLVVPHLLRLVYEAIQRNDWLASNAYWRHLSAYKDFEWCQWAKDQISNPIGFMNLLDELLDRAR